MASAHERQLQIAPLVQESIQHNARVRPSVSSLQSIIPSPLLPPLLPTFRITSSERLLYR